MAKVLIDIKMMVTARIFWRPCLSPMAPNTMPPSGLNTNGMEKVAKAAIICTLGEALGKNTCPKAKATKPYTPKSNHSMALPSAAAVMALRLLSLSMILMSLIWTGLFLFNPRMWFPI